MNAYDAPGTDFEKYQKTLLYGSQSHYDKQHVIKIINNKLSRMLVISV